ncbi:hypothetical protein BDQ12DRAFT_521095, partial [Crucibulum laeve]
MSQPVFPQVCVYHLKNTCQRGTSCPYSHEANASPSSLSMGKKPCPYFQKGTCAFGEKCIQSHEAIAEPVRPQRDKTPRVSIPQLASPVVKVRSSSEEGNSSTDSIPAGNPSLTRFGSSSQSKSSNSGTKASDDSVQRSPCFFFLQTGKCANSDTCKFAHSFEHDHVSKVQTSTSVPSDDEGNRPPSPSDSISDTPITSFEFPTVQVSPYSEEEITEQAQYDDDRPWEREEIHGDQSGSGGSGGSYRDDEDSGYQEEHNQAKGRNSYDHSLYDNKKFVRSHSAEKTRSSADPGSQERNDGWNEANSSAIGHDLAPLSPRQYSTQQPLSTVSAIPPYPHVSEVVPHWSQYADPHANPVTAFCKALARGQCFQGENCLFRHSLTPAEYTLLFKDPQPNLWTLDVRAKRSVHPQIEATAPVEQIRALTVPLIAKVCTFYPLGKCRNGEACPYAHVDSAPSPAISGTQNDSNS